ncbi:hypothetical protein LIER_33348 [Lithospermum erythrorhizon]|uniref:Transmembrane protein n=1 Tax=Lithospermum erythrorhizon TaxID=34254 RepID=A0AAV3RZN0_LITER
MTMNKIRCHCGLVCHPITSWKEAGRRFVKCPRVSSKSNVLRMISNLHIQYYYQILYFLQGDGGCRLWMWKDPPIPEREKNIILGLLKKCNKLDEENARLRMKMKYLSTIAIIGCLVVATYSIVVPIIGVGPLITTPPGLVETKGTKFGEDLTVSCGSVESCDGQG